MSTNLGNTLEILSGKDYTKGNYVVRNVKGTRSVEKFSLDQIPQHRVSYTVPENMTLSVFSQEQMKKFFSEENYSIIKKI